MQQLLALWFYNFKIGCIALVIAAVVFSALEQNFSFRRLKKPWKDTWIDLQFFFTNLLLPPVVNLAFTTFLAFFMTVPRQQNSPMSPMRFSWELLAVLFFFDVWTYCRHRCFHSKRLWSIHSIHHSSEDLNWISGERNHPVEVTVDLIGEFAVFTVSAFAGADAKVLFWAGVIIGVWNFFVHSNTRWTFGPLRYVLTSPVEHRWHHSDSPQAVDKNFAVMFSCIDVALGTFYMPKDVLPKTTGLLGNEKKNHPRTFIGQIIHPFRAK